MAGFNHFLVYIYKSDQIYLTIFPIYFYFSLVLWEALEKYWVEGRRARGGERGGKMSNPSPNENFMKFNRKQKNRLKKVIVSAPRWVRMVLPHSRTFFYEIKKNIYIYKFFYTSTVDHDVISFEEPYFPLEKNNYSVILGRKGL